MLYNNSAPVNRVVDLARHGYAVFPLTENNKPFGNADVAAALGIPEPSQGQGGSHLATRDETAIARLWTAFPAAKIGIATGAASGGLIALDVDRKNGRDGLHTLAALGRHLPTTAWQQTRSGGYHYLYRGPAGQHLPTDAGELGEALDRRGDGGYIVDYNFDLTTPLALAPEWILAGARTLTNGDRKPFGTDNAPTFDDAHAALRNIDNPDGYDDWRNISAAFRQAATGLVHDDLVRLVWESWCAQSPKNNKADNEKLWRSLDAGTQLGWRRLHREAYRRPPQPDPTTLFGGQQHQLPAGASSTPLQPQSASSPQFGEFLTPQEQQQWFRDCVLIGPENRIIGPRGIRYDVGSFNASFGGKRFIIDATGKATDEAWKAATRSTMWTVPKVDGTCFRPDLPTGEITGDGLGRSYLNTYVPARIETLAGDPTPFLRHLSLVLPSPDDQRILLEYLAHNARFPGHKIPWAPLIQSVEGVGKNVFKQVIRHAIDKQYFYQPKAKQLNDSGSKFNGWMDSKLFFLVDEIKTDDKRDMVETLKPFVTETELEIEGKGVNQRMADTPSNWMFFSNHKDAIPVTANGRRFAIFYSAIQTLDDLRSRGMDDAYFSSLYAWLGDHQNGDHRMGLKIAANYLLTYPIERGALPTRAPITTSTAEALIESRGWLETMIADAVDDQRNGFRAGWINTAALGSLLREQRKEVKPRTVGEAIKALGYHPIGQAGRGYFQDDATFPNRRGRLWNTDPLAILANYGRAQNYE